MPNLTCVCFSCPFLLNIQVEDARRLVKFCKQEDVNTQGAVFNLVDEIEVTRDRFFGQQV